MIASCVISLIVSFQCKLCYVDLIAVPHGLIMTAIKYAANVVAVNDATDAVTVLSTDDSGLMPRAPAVTVVLE